MSVQVVGERSESNEQPGYCDSKEYDDYKGHLDVSLVTEDCTKDTADQMERLKRENDALKVELAAHSFISMLALSFRQHACAFVLNKRPFFVRFMTLQLLEIYVHDARLYKNTPGVSERWKEICCLFEWEENFETVPAVVKYADKKARNSPSELYYDINRLDVCVKAGCESLKQLPEDHCACELLELRGKLKELSPQA